MEQEIRLQLSNQLINAVKKADFDTKVHEFRYEHLAALYLISLHMENGKEFFLKIKRQIEDINIRRVRKQRKIIVGFIADDPTAWIGEELYKLFEQSDTFEPYIFCIVSYKGKLLTEEYIQTIAFFQKRGIDVISTFCPGTERFLTWDEIGIRPDICIWMNSWIESFKGGFHLFNYPLDTIHVYLPYGAMIAENGKNDFVYCQYNKYIHNLTWKIFEENKIALDMAEKYCFIGNSNAVYTGSPKLDSLYHSTDQEYDIWGNLLRKSQNPGARKIIYAPHHTIGPQEPIHFSTFADNYLSMLDLAKKHQNNTVWIFKPHPHLKFKAIREGIFADIQGWEAYEQQWRDLKNADVMNEGGYNRLFQESDGMILDSISYLAEYLHAHKPYLFLKRDDQFFNDFGKKLINILYEADGKDQNAIETFITRVVIDGNDEKREMREYFFSENIDYVKINGINASQNIYRIFEQEFIDMKY